MIAFDLPGFSGTLVRASLAGGAFALVVWVLLALVPRVPATLRCWLWWAVCLRFSLGLAGLPVLELPLLAPSAPAPPVEVLSHAAPVGEGASAIAATAQPASASAFPTALVAVWLAGVVLALLLLLRDALRARRLLASARPAEPSSLTQLFSELCQRFRLRSAQLSTSHQVASPQVLGLLRAHVLIPQPSLTQLSTPELAMALAHELAHVVRGDLLLGWVPALARRLFFFHPLAALAAREYALAREAACDAEVLRVLGSAPQSYGRLLLQWGVVPRETGLAAAAAAPSLRLLKRRLSMLDHASPLSTRRRAAWWLAAGAVALAGLVPLKLVAQSARPARPARPAVAAVPAVAPAVAPAAVPAVAPAPAVEPTPAVERIAAAPPVPPAPPAPPAPPKPAREGRYSYSWSDDDDGNSWVYLTGDASAVMSGSSDDLRRAKKLRGGSDDPILFYRQNGKAYVVRDPALLAQIESLYEPVRRLGEQQGELGAKQGELGAQQGRWGAQQGVLGARQGELGAKMGAVGARLATDPDDESLDAEMERLSEEMDRLGEEMDKLGEPMEELGRQMEVFGEQMEALGEQMEAASEKAEREMAALIQKAIQSGLAEEVK